MTAPILAHTQSQPEGQVRRAGAPGNQRDELILLDGAEGPLKAVCLSDAGDGCLRVNSSHLKLQARARRWATRHEFVPRRPKGFRDFVQAYGVGLLDYCLSSFGRAFS